MLSSLILLRTVANFSDICDTGYTQVNGNCVRIIGTPEPFTGNMETGTLQGKDGFCYTFYWWTRFAAAPTGMTLDCTSTHCQLVSMRILVNSDIKWGERTYHIGVALYSDNGTVLCNAESPTQHTRNETDFWLSVNFPSRCSTLTGLYNSSNSFYLGMWSSQNLNVRWEIDPIITQRTHAHMVWTMPLPVLPTWHNDDCSGLQVPQCKQWGGHYHGLISQLFFTGGEVVSTVAKSSLKLRDRQIKPHLDVSASLLGARKGHMKELLGEVDHMGAEGDICLDNMNMSKNVTELERNVSSVS